jgi:hypothetical protein
MTTSSTQPPKSHALYAGPILAANRRFLIPWIHLQIRSGQARAETKTIYYRADLKIIVDGRETTLDVTPFIIDPDWIMVPAEFISKELGASVAWDDASSAFTITTDRWWVQGLGD